MGRKSKGTYLRMTSLDIYMDRKNQYLKERISFEEACKQTRGTHLGIEKNKRESMIEYTGS